MIPRVKTKVTKNKKLTAVVHQVTFKMIDPPELEFQSGQHFIFEIDPRNVRQFSIATEPQIKDRFELCVDVGPQGPGSQFIQSLQPKDKVECRGPIGRFVLPQNLKPRILFIATGVGISPFKSMLFDLYHRRAQKEIKNLNQIELYFGVRYPKDIFYFDIFEKLAADWPVFKFLPTLSRPDQSWTGLKGRVTDHLSQKEIDADAQAFLCGSGEMIMDVKKLLVEKGLAPEQIFFEKFFE